MVVDSFWKKWTRDYFPTLVPRQKWHTERRNVTKGDVVLLKDANAIRGEWKLAIVTDTTSSNDGKVRRVTVSYKNHNDKEAVQDYAGVPYTSVERPVHNLVVIVAAEEANHQ